MRAFVEGPDATRLRRHGLRVTAPRLAVLAHLAEIGGHRSADELVTALRAGGYHHARTTVYNALDDLTRAGLVLAAPVDAGALRFELARPAHHHFVCRQCGRITDVAIDQNLIGWPLPDLGGAEVEQMDVVFRGRCELCAVPSEAAPDGEGASAAPPAPGVTVDS